MTESRPVTTRPRSTFSARWSPTPVATRPKRPGEWAELPVAEGGRWRRGPCP